ncbi:hypothetical protein [Azospirillum canadense]|uniref:hypothetical protein n=1 Tax=Azospirillum canadense TaxID=403962 RepID=UPI002225DA41|nr:hypothetical protein [Azospirillum canadense]MCW2238299.1 hypothetical protein [Azospirillum canadense]
MGNHPTLPGTVTECRIQAHRLLKAARDGDDSALRRLSALPAPERWQLKHALAVIALDAGFPTWPALKAHFEGPDGAPAVDTERFFDGRGSAYLNRWFRDLATAEESLRADGGWLFPYRHQFFICEAGFLDARGIPSDDPDWALIGHNWARPADAAAHARLTRRLAAAGLAAGG